VLEGYNIKGNRIPFVQVGMKVFKWLKEGVELLIAINERVI
jgi:hypothetical protein